MVGGQPARVPPGVCIYAVGDIHGRADLLERMHGLIAADAMNLTPGTDKLIVYLGDYVDHGSESRRVIDLMVHKPLPEFRTVHLLGEQDIWMLGFLADPRIGSTWLRHGGAATVHSYGVQPGEPRDELPYYKLLQTTLRQCVPRKHVNFLCGLEVRFECGDYLFVHAGVNPRLPLDRQPLDDLLRIKEPFLSSNLSLARVVVHGHTVAAKPTVQTNRIGIDTGAYRTGRLTCLVLEEAAHRFLTVW
jgi:serine/threonine protein phosphatase 1